jgi:RimJ/RimL family protein N-acetyltransferase
VQIDSAAPPADGSRPATDDVRTRETNATPGFVLETQRLMLRRLSCLDAAFMLELLNDPAFIENVGDKGVRTEADAARYIAQGAEASYERFGFGMWLVALKDGGSPVGICGLVRRDELPHADLGFAFLPRHRSLGYAHESAAAVMRHARSALALGRLLAVVVPGNVASRRLLGKLGFHETRPGADDSAALMVLASDP